MKDMHSFSPDKTDTQSFEMGGQCPFGGDRIGGVEGTPPTLSDWYPNRLKVELLHQNGPQANPLGDDFDYAEAFNAIDLEALKTEIKGFLTTSVDWWPSDYNNYGPQMIRMAWHSAGTYRIADGRGGAGAAMQRFAPIESWWDNGNIDKSRRLIWPIKQKYGSSLSWADLIVLTGNCALEIMGFPTYGFAGGRQDAWEADNATYWGPEVWDGHKVNTPDAMVMRDKRWRGQNGDADYDLENPLAASFSSIIYVNPEGPYGKGDPLGSAHDIRITFTRMAMNDEETVALIAGGHTFGKTHGAADPAEHVGSEPAGASLEELGQGWRNSFGKGHSEHTITSGLEGAWTSTPAKWSNDYFNFLFGFEWELTKSPAGAHQWRPVNGGGAGTIPDAHDPAVKHAPFMLTTDIALRADPAYEVISRRFQQNPDEFADAFARAWFKLTHRDMGPKERYLGPEVPTEELLWQDPIPAVTYQAIDNQDVATLKSWIAAADLSVQQLVSTGWASASTYRGSDKRGGTNGGRLRLLPQRNWAVNQPAQLAEVLRKLEGIQQEFNSAQTGGKQVSMADLIVLAGIVGIEQAARNAGHEVTVPFTPGRADASQEQTDVVSFAALEPAADGFRNYLKKHHPAAAEELLIDKAQLLTLTAPELTVLFGGLRAININFDQSLLGVFTNRAGSLTNDYFLNLLDLNTTWAEMSEAQNTFQGRDRKTGQTKWTGSRVDLIFGSNSELRALAEVYACQDSQEKFVQDFVAVWAKVMNLGRFDLAKS